MESVTNLLPQRTRAVVLRESEDFYLASSAQPTTSLYSFTPARAARLAATPMPMPPPRYRSRTRRRVLRPDASVRLDRTDRGNKWPRSAIFNLFVGALSVSRYVPCRRPCVRACVGVQVGRSARVSGVCHCVATRHAVASQAQVRSRVDPDRRQQPAPSRVKWGGQYSTPPYRCLHGRFINSDHVINVHPSCKQRG
jgi:hypothetical protein